MPSPKLALVFTFVGLSILSLGCQSAEPPAPFGLSPDRLSMDVTTSDMTIVNGEVRSSLGTARREAASVTLNGEEAIRFVLVQELRMGTMYDTLWVKANTLLPIKYRNHFGELQTIRMEYGSDGHVVSEVKRGDVVTGVDTTLTGLYLDQAEFSMLIPALPLAEGYEAEIPVVHYENGVNSVAVRVVGSDTVEHRGESRSVWIVEQEVDGRTARQFIDKENGTVLRTEATVGPDRQFEEVAQ